MPLPPGISRYKRGELGRRAKPSPAGAAIATWLLRQRAFDPPQSDPRTYANTVLDPDAGPESVFVSVGVERRPDGSGVCTRVVIEAPSHPTDLTPAITAQLLRRLAFAPLIREAGAIIDANERLARGIVAEFHREAGIEPPEWPALPSIETRVRPRGRPRLEDHRGGALLREVADIFTEAVNAGRPPVKAVEEHFRCPRRTAQNRIKRARDEGVLAVPRRAPGRRSLPG